MTDIRRSILWVIFGFSMVLIWDKWQLHNGKPATFFPQAAPVAAAKAAGGPAEVPAATALPGQAPAQAMPAAAPATPRVTHTATTDVLKLTFDSEGGTLVGADILKHNEATLSSKNQDVKPLTLLTPGPDHIYVAQSGLIGGAQNVAALPTHKTPMALVTADAALKDGQDSLTVRFESADLGGVKLAKTYTVRKGAYDLAVKHDPVLLHVHRPSRLHEREKIPESGVCRDRQKQRHFPENRTRWLRGHGAALLCQRLVAG
jgi:YidC/Oxa1 family membrane protein insertase